MHQARFGIHTNTGLHAGARLVLFFGERHLRGSFALVILVNKARQSALTVDSSFALGM